MLASIPRVVRIEHPSAVPAPAVFDSPHSGIDYPEDFAYAAPFADVHAACDAYVDELFAAAPAFGAIMIAAEFPRAYIDPNRALEDIDLAMLDGAWPGPVSPSEKSAAGRGLIRSTARGGAPLYDRRLTAAEIEARIERYWRPYNHALEAALDRVRAEAGAVWHVNCHSMGSLWSTPSGRGGSAVGSDFIIGDRDGTTCEPEFTELVRATLADMGYRVAVNDRFKGVELLRRHGRPQEGRHSLQIEVVRRLYMDEDTLEKSPDFERVRADMTRLVAAVCDYARSRAG